MAQPSTSHPWISCADRKIRYGPITHHYSDRLLADTRQPVHAQDGLIEEREEDFVVLIRDRARRFAPVGIDEADRTGMDAQRGQNSGGRLPDLQKFG